MSRRASYMYGNLLPVDAKGQVGAGLGMTTSTGTITLIPPTHTIAHTGEKMNIDGLDFEFMMAPDSEAPAEMHWYIEQLKAVTAAENCCHTQLSHIGYASQRPSTSHRLKSTPHKGFIDCSHLMNCRNLENLSLSSFQTLLRRPFPGEKF